jgi:hypothetical protein
MPPLGIEPPLPAPLSLPALELPLPPPDSLAPPPELIDIMPLALNSPLLFAGLPQAAKPSNAATVEIPPTVSNRSARIGRSTLDSLRAGFSSGIGSRIMLRTKRESSRSSGKNAGNQ